MFISTQFFGWFPEKWCFQNISCFIFCQVKISPIAYWNSTLSSINHMITVSLMSVAQTVWDELKLAYNQNWHNFSNACYKSYCAQRIHVHIFIFCDLIIFNKMLLMYATVATHFSTQSSVSQSNQQTINPVLHSISNACILMLWLTRHEEKALRTLFKSVQWLSW